MTHASGHKLAETNEGIGAPTTGVSRGALAELRPITVLSGSILGFPLTAGELDPEELLDTIDALHRTCAEVISRYGGFAAFPGGDALFAYFGCPAAHEDDAERAVRAGLTLVDTIGQFEAPDRL